MLTYFPAYAIFETFTWPFSPDFHVCLFFSLTAIYLSVTRELPGVALENISNWKIFMGNTRTFVCSEMSSYLRLQSLNSDSKQTTGHINLKPTLVTPAGLEVFEEAYTTYEFLVSEAASRTNLKTDYRNIISPY